MASWGRRDGDALTGNVSIASGNTELQGLTGATFLTELEVGVTVTAGSPAQQFTVVSITDANTAVVSPAANAAIVDLAAVLDDKPLWLDRASQLNTINVSVAEAQDAANNAIGLKTPGWTSARVYTTHGGTVTRRFVEPLVAMKDPN